MQLHAHVLPENAVNQNLHWEITTIQGNNPRLTIDQNGLLTAHSKGSGYYTVTVTSEWGEYVAKCYVQIKEREHATNVIIGEYNATMTIGETYQFSATVYPDDAVNKNVTWTSSNKDVLAVTPDGLATAVGLGTAYLTVKAEDLNRGVFTDPGQMLQGKVPGLVVSSTADPNGGPTITLRGASTLRTGAMSYTPHRCYVSLLCHRRYSWR